MSSSSSSTPTCSKSLGKWFPTATVRKTIALNPSEKCSLLLFYHYVRPSMSQARADHLKTFLEKMTAETKVGGRLRCAREGLNCTISGTYSQVRSFSSRLKTWGTSSLPSGVKGPFEEGVDFKYVDSLPPSRAFKDVKVLPVSELVFYGVGESSAPLSNGGVHLQPKEYHEKMEEDNTVIIDVRNTYEADIGKFNGQEKVGGAEYIDPKMRKSTDFKSWLSKEEVRSPSRPFR